jgi:signal transduction histidine kinase
VWDVYPPEYADHHMKAVRSALESGAPTVRQAQSLVRGRLRWFEARIQPLREPDGAYRRALVILTDMTERKEAEDRILTYQERLRSLTSELALTEQRERKRLASELHDRIGQSLAVSKIKLGALRKSAAHGVPSQTIEEVWNLIDQTIQDTRTLTFELSPPILHELGLEPALEWLVETFRVGHGIAAIFHDDGWPKPLGSDLSGLLFQSVQELLINAAKHGHPSRVEVTARREGNEIRLEVADDGSGFDPSQIGASGQSPYGFGLFSIRERLGPLGGGMEVRSSPGHGTTVVLSAPLVETVNGHRDP